MGVAVSETKYLGTSFDVQSATCPRANGSSVVLNTLHEVIFKKQDHYNNVSSYVVITVTFPLRKKVPYW